MALLINSFVGKSVIFDHFAKIAASDYLFPLIFSVVIFAIWFVGRDLTERRRYQRGTLISALAIGFSNIAVDFINANYDRPRPFEDLGDSITLLFYQSTDPSFPANPMAVVFAIAMGVMLVDRKLGWILIGMGAVYSVLRIYVGTFYPTDVMGGAVIGILAALFAWFMFELMKPVPEVLLRILRGVGVA